MPNPSLSPCFHNPCIWQGVQSWNFSLHNPLQPLRSKYMHEHSVLKHPYSMFSLNVIDCFTSIITWHMKNSTVIGNCFFCKCQNSRDIFLLRFLLLQWCGIVSLCDRTPITPWHNTTLPKNKHLDWTTVKV
jgi:hypothetical protein